MTALFVCATYSAQAFEALQCPIGEPMASWDFNAGDLPSSNTAAVRWNGDHGGIKSVPGHNLQGIKFGYRGKGPEGDATSEWRYKINMPLSRTWEYLRVFQPDNFEHRYFVKIKTPAILSDSEWRKGDEIENPRGMTATVEETRESNLFIKHFNQRFDKNWGNGLIIRNKTTGASTEALDSRNVGTNNKLSAQWEGDYSSGGMIVETQAYPPANGGEAGVGYFRPTITRSEAHRASGTVGNEIGNNKPSPAFNPRDNGTVVEFVIERIKSSGENIRDGSYKIWKRTATTPWSLVYINNSIYAWQPNNFFDNGYVFGWANSGYSEDTAFYLLGWSLWAEKPAFLP